MEEVLKTKKERQNAVIDLLKRGKGDMQNNRLNLEELKKEDER